MTAENDEIYSTLVRIENAVGILRLRTRPHPVEVMQEVSSVLLVKSILLDAASALDHFTGLGVSGG